MEEVIKAENLTKAYGTLLAADHVNLRVKRGTAFGLLGANGAGKSTVIECILGTKQPDGGTVSVLSLNPRKDRCLFQQVGVQRIVARHDVNNPHSGGVMRKCGMKFEEIREKANRNNQGECDCAYYGIEASDR